MSQGRGFAVVASEVRSLAQRSSQAAKDIKDLITNSSGQVQEGVELVNRGRRLARPRSWNRSRRWRRSCPTSPSASAEQATGIDQVNDGARRRWTRSRSRTRRWWSRTRRPPSRLEQQSQMRSAVRSCPPMPCSDTPPA